MCYRLRLPLPNAAVREASGFGDSVPQESTHETGVDMNDFRKKAAGAFLILLLSGLAFSLFLVVYGFGIASEYAGKGGGGLGVLVGWGTAGIGCFLGISILAAGVPANRKIGIWARTNRQDCGDASDRESD